MLSSERKGADPIALCRTNKVQCSMLKTEIGSGIQTPPLSFERTEPKKKNLLHLGQNLVDSSVSSFSFIYRSFHILAVQASIDEIFENPK